MEAVKDKPVFDTELQRIVATEDIINEFRHKVTEVPDQWNDCKYNVAWVNPLSRKAVKCDGKLTRHSLSRRMWEFRELKILWGTLVEGEFNVEGTDKRPEEDASDKV